MLSTVAVRVTGRAERDRKKVVDSGSEVGYKVLDGEGMVPDPTTRKSRSVLWSKRF